VFPAYAGMNLSETEIQKQILDYLTTVGIFAWRNNSGRRGKVSYGLPGSCDILGILPDGRFLGIEVKGPTTKVQDNQYHFMRTVNDNNGLAFIAYSVEDVENELSQAAQI